MDMLELSSQNVCSGPPGAPPGPPQGVLVGPRGCLGTPTKSWKILWGSQGAFWTILRLPLGLPGAPPCPSMGLLAGPRAPPRGPPQNLRRFCRGPGGPFERPSYVQSINLHFPTAAPLLLAMCRYTYICIYMYIYIYICAARKCLYNGLIAYL